MDQERLAELHSRAEAELGRIPGVMGVGFGLKEVGGLTTEERAFRVYVREKKPLADVPADEVLPREFEGVPVDVLVVRDFEPLHCEDMTQHHPLIGGISVSNFYKSADDKYGSGTLGFFATLDGVSGPKNVVLVSNNHVLMANGAKVGDTIYQPKYVDQGGGKVVIDLNADSRRGIAEIHDAGVDGRHSFAYPGERPVDHYVDASDALLNISVSSWCDSNCGVSYRNEVRNLDIGGNSRIEGVARVTQADVKAADYAVFKVGRRTSKTVGKVVDAVAVLTTGERVIEIEPTQPDCDGLDRFVEEGDSGSALINAQNMLVGLVFGKGKGDEARKGFASHIHPVMDKLKITPISVANPPVKPAGQPGKGRVATAGEQDRSLQLRQQAQGNPGSAELFAAFEEHREEAVGLVNYHRPVTVAWHKGKGPAWLAHFAENARRPEHRIPFEIDGVTRRDLVTRLADAFEVSGSERLRAAVAAQRDAVLAMIEGFDDLHELVGRIEENPATG